MAEPLVFSDEQKRAFRAAYAPGATDDQWKLFISECERRALVPGVHVVFQVRSAMEFNPTLRQRVPVAKVTLITTINALRLIADRSGKYEGHSPFLYYYQDENGKLTGDKIPAGRIPHAVSVEGYRKGWREPLFTTARYDAYVQTKDDNGKKSPTHMWAVRGEEQLAKCCEALMLRTVTPEESGGLLISEELENEVVDKPTGYTGPAEPQTPVVVPQATTAPPVNQGAGDVPSANPAVEVAKAVPSVVPTPATPTAAPTSPKVSDGGPVVPNRLPAKQEDVKESFAELKELAARVDRDSDPKEPATEPAKKTAAVTPEVKPVIQPDAQTLPTAANPCAVASTPEVKPVISADGYVPVSPSEYQIFINQRAAKIARDHLPKAGIKSAEAGNLMKEYLLKESGRTGLKQISSADFERLLSALETATPEQAVALLRKK